MNAGKSVPLVTFDSRPLVRLRLLVFGAALAVAFAVRVALAWHRATPYYFPDEYLYSAIGHSLAHLSGPEVRGGSAHFSALFAPILTAPAWLAGGVANGFRLAQVISSASMTLAAIPAYLLARRLGLGLAAGAACAALTIAVPDMIYAGFVLSEPFSYPLVLGACVAATCALAAPTRRNQIVFLVLAGLSAFARVQMIILPLAFVGALLLIAVRERSFRTTFRRQRLPLTTIGAGIALAAVAVSIRGFGYYKQASEPHFAVSTALRSLGENVVTLMYAGGWVLIPGAAIGLALALARPRTRLELAFGAITVTLGAALLLEAGIFGAAWGQDTMIQERYTFYLIPLLAISFGLCASRGLPHRLAHVVLALALLVIAVRLPLSGWARPGLDDQSAFLVGVENLEATAGGDAQGATDVMVVATVLGLLAAAAPWLRARGAALVFACAIAASLAGFAAATRYDHHNASQLVEHTLPPDPSWVDHAGLGPTTLLVSPGGPGDAELELFWNTSIDRLALLPGGSAPDLMASEHLRIASDGTLLNGGRPVSGALLAGRFGSTAIFQDAQKIASSRGDTLWLPRGTARLRLLFQGRGFNGGLTTSGRITVWPTGRRLAGRLTFAVRGLAGKPISFAIAGRRRGKGRISLPVCSAGPWTAAYTVTGPGELQSQRKISGFASVPVYVPDAAACAAP